MRKPLIAGNWKMHTDPEDAFELMDTMIEHLDAIEGVDVVVCPPFVSIETLGDMFDGTNLFLGAQNMHWEDRGAYTGEISPVMLKGRCDYVILGHSERRHIFHETDEDVRRKVNAAISHDLRPIICVGETLAQHEAKLAEEVVDLQVTSAFADLSDVQAQNCVVAYEPVWAIGTGRPASGQIANGVIGMIRRKLTDLYGEDVGGTIRILYGGSVNAQNIKEFVSQPEIDGALVGTASLDADEFVRIVAVTNEVKHRRGAGHASSRPQANGPASNAKPKWGGKR